MQIFLQIIENLSQITPAAPRTALPKKFISQNTKRATHIPYLTSTTRGQIYNSRDKFTIKGTDNQYLHIPHHFVPQIFADIK